MTIRRKFLLTFVFLIILASLTTGIFSLQISKKYYTAAVKEDLKHNTNLVHRQLQRTPLADYAEEIHSLSILGDARITLIDVSGQVIADTERDPKNMENHLDRPEVLDALRNNEGMSTRYSRTIGYSFMYRALRLKTNEFDGILRLSVPLIKLKNIQRQITVLSFLSILIGTILAMIIALRITNTISEPIQELMKAAKDISKGKLSRRVYVDTIDEIGMLSRTFNYMSIQLEDQVRELKDRTLKLESILSSMIEGIIAIDKDFNIMLINPVSIMLFDIDKDEVIGKPVLEVVRNPQIYNILEASIQEGDYTVKEVIIRSKKEKIVRIYANPIFSNVGEADILGTLLVIEDITNIRKLEQMRTEFVSNVTHELKTPLTSIRGFVDTLRNGAIEDTRIAKRFLEIIEVEAERLQRLIQDILLLSEIETKDGLWDENIEELSVRSVIQEIADILSYKIQEKNILFALEISKEIPSVEMNRDRLKQILINLLDNAIHYTPEAGRVSLRCFKQEKNLVMEVEDNGVGIPEEDIPRIFERFYRVDKDRSRKKGGTGLGLSIVKHIVKLYDGEIYVKSQVERGSIFSITLPLFKS